MRAVRQKNKMRLENRAKTRASSFYNQASNTGYLYYCVLLYCVHCPT